MRYNNQKYLSQANGHLWLGLYVRYYRRHWFNKTG